MKYLQHTYETPETLKTYACNMHVYATSLSTFLSKNITIYFCNIKMKHLKHTFEATEIFETYACNMKYMFATCVYSHCNIYNIQMKHLKHMSETPETLETWHRQRPRPTWWGTAVASSGQAVKGDVKNNSPTYTSTAVLCTSSAPWCGMVAAWQGRSARRTGNGWRPPW
jgi:hypothetical protein